MRTRLRLSTYEQSFWDKQSQLVASIFPRLNELIGITRITNWLPEYLKKYPCEKSNSVEIGEHFPKFLRQHESLRELPHLAELARFEWALLMARTNLQLFSSLYPLHLDQKNKFTIKTKKQNFYALKLHSNRVTTHVLTGFEFRLLHWFKIDSQIEPILKKSALLGYNENNTLSIIESLIKRNLLESKLRYPELA